MFTPTALAALLFDVAAAGGVAVTFGRIDGHAGWLDFASRTIVLNPDATPERLEAELLHDLAALRDQQQHQRRPPDRLRLLEGGRSTTPTGNPDLTSPQVPPRVAE